MARVVYSASMVSPSRWLTVALPIALPILLAASCAAIGDDLRRAEQSYDQARYEDAQVWLIELERDEAQMDHGQRVRFHYLRGMTAFRLDDRRSALHYLAICNEENGEHGDALREEWRAALLRTLAELSPEDYATER